ncbi:MAG: Gfo/Idh/MocA family oxidoreductase [Caldilineaceae bacterium]
MTTPIRIGVIGTSWWADLGHLPFLSTDDRAQLVAICGRNQERAQAMATKYNIPQIFADHHTMFADGALDAVVILAPDDEHYTMTMAALDAGLHVLCEKPLARNVVHAKNMYERAEVQGVRHMTYFTWRWLPHYRYLRDLIAQGVVGRLYHAHFNFMAGNGRNPAYAWRFDPQRASGVLGDYGSHMIDLARYLVGDIGRVHARLTTNAPRNGPHGQPLYGACDAATLLLEFLYGGQGTIELSAVARTHDPALEHAVVLHGEAGSLTATFGLFTTPPKVQLAGGDNGFQDLAIPDQYLLGLDPTQPVGPQMGLLFSQPGMGSRSFVDAIVNGQTVAPSFYEGWQVQRVIDAAIASQESGGWVGV